MKSLDVAYNKGCFFSRIYELTCQDYGYGTGLFYSMLPSSMIVLIKNWFNVSFNFAIGMEILLILFISAVLVYKFVFNITQKEKTSLLCALCYILFPYVLVDIFIRFSLAEIWYILLVPVIVTSLYELIVNKNYFKFFGYFVIGFSLGIMVHLTLTLYIAFFSLIYLMLNYKAFLQRKLYLSFRLRAFLFC